MGKINLRAIADRRQARIRSGYAGSDPSLSCSREKRYVGATMQFTSIDYRGG